MTTVQALVIGAGIRGTITEDWNDNAPDWAQDKARHYRVRLRYENRTMSLWYYQGLGITREPSVADIVETLACDSHSQYDTLDDFIDELGLTITSLAHFRTYERQYKQLNRQNKSFNRLIGNPELIARLQEIA